MEAAIKLSESFINKPKMNFYTVKCSIAHTRADASTQALMKQVRDSGMNTESGAAGHRLGSSDTNNRPISPQQSAVTTHLESQPPVIEPPVISPSVERESYPDPPPSVMSHNTLNPGPSDEEGTSTQSEELLIDLGEAGPIPRVAGSFNLLEPHFLTNQEDLLEPHFSTNQKDLLEPQFSTNQKELLEPHFSTNQEDLLEPHFSTNQKDLLEPHFSTNQKELLEPHFSTNQEDLSGEVVGTGLLMNDNSAVPLKADLLTNLHYNEAANSDEHLELYKKLCREIPSSSYTSQGSYSHDSEDAAHIQQSSDNLLIDLDKDEEDHTPRDNANITGYNHYELLSLRPPSLGLPPLNVDLSSDCFAYSIPPLNVDLSSDCFAYSIPPPNVDLSSGCFAYSIPPPKVDLSSDCFAYSIPASMITNSESSNTGDPESVCGQCQCTQNVVTVVSERSTESKRK